VTNVNKKARRILCAFVGLKFMPHNLFIWLFIVGATAILLSLGQWQVDRLVWKQSILEEIDGKISGLPQYLPSDVKETEHKYLPVQISGKIKGSFIKVMASQKFIGAGYRIVTPFELQKGNIILVDLGFIRHEFASKISLSGDLNITGNLHWPNEVDFFTPDPDQKNNVWFARDVNKLSKELTTEPILVVAKSFSPSIVHLDPLPINTKNIPNNHKQYAITWFALAFIWLGMGLFFIYRTSKTRGRKI
jgi:surfeit locus 1 family protein